MSRRQKLLVAVLTVGAAATLVAAALAALATSFDPNGNYVSIAGTNLHQTPPIANTSRPPDCTAAELASLPPGGVLWHFVLTQSSDNAGVLRADFATAGLTVPDVQENPVPGVLDWTVITPTADTLLNASTNRDGGLLNLSHVCYVRQVTPTIVTTIHLDPTHGAVTTVNLGDKVHDSATVTSTAGTPTGTVDFKFFNGPCGGDGTQIGTTSTVALVNGVADPSAASPALAAGNYHYSAHYNSNNATWTSADADCEPLTVNKAQLTIVTHIHNAAHQDITNTHVPLGSVAHDTATVTGQVPGFDPSGAISFTLNAAPVANPAEAGFSASTIDSAPLAAGSYTYNASVAGDNNYIGDNSPDEPLTVDKGNWASGRTSTTPRTRSSRS